MGSSIQNAYLDVYRNRSQLQDATNDPGLKQHYQAELDQIRKTLEAMGVAEGDIQDAGSGSTGGGIDGVEDEPAPTTQPGVFYQAPAAETNGNTNGNTNNSTSGQDTGQGTKVGSGLPAQGEQYRESIESASAKSGVPASLLAGLIHDESRWKSDASTVNGGNGGGDTGLVQMNDGTFAELQKKHPDLAGKNKNDPDTNILAGAYYLADMKAEMNDKFGVNSWEIALRAYNSGPNGVDPNNLNALPAGTGTDTYVDKVMAYWRTIDQGGQLPA
jgi:soluble lytic murein transglycosylase-like protein